MRAPPSGVGQGLADTVEGKKILVHRISLKIIEMFRKFKSVPNYDPNYIQYDPKNWTNI